MARRRAAPSSAGLLLLLPLALVGYVIGKAPDAPPVRSSAPVSYVSLPAELPVRASIHPPVEARAADPGPAPTSTLAPERRPADPTPPDQLYVSGHKVPMRATADPKAAVLDRLGPGQAVSVVERRQDWILVRHGLTRREGWIQAKRLRGTPPAEEDESPKVPSVGPTLSAAAIAKLLIAESIASYPGSCACPYQSDRGGRSCGRRAAYVRPGGYAPLCFSKDITTEMVANYRQKR